jgi:hypothetical protein
MEWMRAEIKAHHERMMAIIKPRVKVMKSVPVHERVPKEEPAVKPIRALKKRH